MVREAANKQSQISSQLFFLRRFGALCFILAVGFLVGCVNYTDPTGYFYKVGSVQPAEPTVFDEQCLYAWPVA